MCKASSATWGGSPEGLGVQQLSIGCQIRRGPHFSKPRRSLPPCLHKFAGQHLCAALDTLGALCESTAQHLPGNNFTALSQLLKPPAALPATPAWHHLQAASVTAGTRLSSVHLNDRPEARVPQKAQE